MIVRIGDVEFATALFPKDGRHLLPVKEALREGRRYRAGRFVSVALYVGRG